MSEYRMEKYICICQSAGTTAELGRINREVARIEHPDINISAIGARMDIYCMQEPISEIPRVLSIGVYKGRSYANELSALIIQVHTCRYMYLKYHVKIWKIEYIVSLEPSQHVLSYFSYHPLQSVCCEYSPRDSSSCWILHSFPKASI